MATSLTLTSFFLLTLPLLLLIPSSAAQCRPVDRSALLQIKADYGTPLATWNSTNANCCSWTFVTCWATGEVSGIFASGANLSGPISPAIGRLANLSSIRLDDNSLTGPIPAFLSKLTYLTYLNLGNNKLSSPIPAFLADLPLNMLYLDHNSLTDNIPPFLGRSELVSLYLDHNNLIGPIPASFAGSQVAFLKLDNNKLTGDPLVLFCGNSYSSWLYLNSNRFKLNLSSVTFSLGLAKLDIHDNMIYGEISKQINELKKLSYFNVCNNQLCGEIPITGWLGRIHKLKKMAFAQNKCLCGSPHPPCS